MSIIGLGANAGLVEDRRAEPELERIQLANLGDDPMRLNFPTDLEIIMVGSCTV